MTDPANSDLGGRLRLLAPPIEPPADVMVSLRPRIRRRQVMRAGVAALATAVVVASAVTIPGLFGGTGGPTRAQVQSLVAQGERPAVRYTGADIPEQLKNVPLWLVAERHAGTNTLALVAYTTGGHPCLGSIDTSRLQSQPITAFEGSCSESDMIEALGDYQPFGQLDERGPDAVFYGTVPADVRIVEANTTSGTLAAR
ncbi:MAG: hypothetical protein QOF18_1276, partial [Frankiaceae bacterium]|nr:hypothetical protein [Frankiaceae bacterium]